VASDGLMRVRQLLAQGQSRKAFRELERARRDALGREDIELLVRILRFARETHDESGGALCRSLDWLIYAAEQNVRELERRGVLRPRPLSGQDESQEPAQRARRRVAPPTLGPEPEPEPVDTAGLGGRLYRLALKARAFSVSLSGVDARAPHLSEDLAVLEQELKVIGRELVELRIAAEEAEELAAAERLAEPVGEPEPPEPARRVEYVGPPLGEIVSAALGRAVGSTKAALETLWTRLEAMGPRAFAWAGGIVMLLGIVFLFSLASSRGWIGPGIRLGIGGLASGLILLAGLRLRARYGQLQSALAAVGVGLAGWYATLIAASALYDYLPAAGALAAAAAIAAAGVAISLLWSSQLVAALTLIGAMLLPVTVLAEGKRSVLAAGFVAIVMAASAAVAIRRRWTLILVAAAAASAPQMGVLVGLSGPAEPDHWRVLAIAWVFWAVYLTTGIAYQRTQQGSALRPLTALFVLPSGGLAAGASAALLAGSWRGVDREGLALLAVASVYAVLGAGFMRRREVRDLSFLLWGECFAVGVFALGDLFTGGPLVGAWAVQAPLLAWFARRARKPRFQIAGAGYLLLGLIHVLIYEAPPRNLFVALAHPGEGALTAGFVAVAAALLAAFSRFEPNPTASGRLDALAAALVRHPFWRASARSAAVVLGLYSLSLAVLELAQDLSSAGLEGNFQRGEVAVTGLWAAGAAALVLLGRLRVWPRAQQAGVVLFGLTLAKTVGFDTHELSETQRSAAFLAVAALALAAGFLAQRLTRTADEILPELVVAVPVSLALALAAVTELTGGRALGFALLGVAVTYGALAAEALRLRLRDAGTLLWTPALALVVAGCTELLSGWGLVLAGSAIGAGLALLAGRIREPRMLVASGVYLVLSLGYALGAEAPPRDLFVATHHPGAGAVSVAFVVAAAAVLASRLGGVERIALVLATGVVGVYALSLGLLELFQALGAASVETRFDRGQVALSAVWAAAGLAALEAGLRRKLPELRAGGLAVLAIVLLKLLAFDVHELPRTHRSLSLLIVAAFALIAGLRIQRSDARPLLLRPEAAAGVLVSAALATVAIVTLAGGRAQAGGLLGLAALYGALGGEALRMRLRDLSTLLSAPAVVLAVAGCTELVSGWALVLAGSAAAAVLALLAARLKEPRLLLVSGGYLALSLGYALAVEASPRNLFVASHHPGLGAASLAFVGAAAAVLARSARLHWPQAARAGALALGGLLALDALSLVVLQLAQALGSAGLQGNFERGEIALTGLWGACGAALALAAARLSPALLRPAGLGLLGLTLLKSLAFDVSQLSERQRSLAFLLLAGELLAAGYGAERLARRPQPLRPETLVLLLVNVGLTSAAVVALTSGNAQASVLLGLAALYSLLTAVAYRLRSLSALMAVAALGLASAGVVKLVSGPALVFAATAASAALSLLAERTRDRRLLLVAPLYLLLAFLYSLVVETPFRRLFLVNQHPGIGAASLVFVAVAALVYARACRIPWPEGPGAGVVGWLRERRELWRVAALWVAALLALYAFSLTILEIAEDIGGADLRRNFQRGHVAVSMVWAAIGLAFVYFGLHRRRLYRAVGFGLFASSIVKLFVYDLPNLSSVTRALSFLGVGALLLVAGIVYQRLERSELEQTSEHSDEGTGAPPSGPRAGSSHAAGGAEDA
jgi:uncharacterized membrane protein